MRTFAWITLLLAVLMLMAPTLGCSCDDDDDDDTGAPADDDADDDTDDDMDDDVDDDDTSPQCLDEDGDTYGENCVAGPDCNDGDGAVWTIVTGYVDADADTYPGTGVDLCTDGTLPSEYFAESTDCDDADPTVHPGAIEFPDDGIDQDCDDADAQASESDGYFVDGAGGNDANPGTMDEPVETIQAGIDLAAGDEDRPNVYVAEGTYTEDAEVPLESVVNLFGGYDPETWTRDVKAPTVLEADTVEMGLFIRTRAAVVIQGMTIVGHEDTESIGVGTEVTVDLTVADSTLRALEGTGPKIGLHMQNGTALRLYRTTLDAEGSTDNSAYGAYVYASDITAIDCEFNAGDSSSTSGGLFMLQSNAELTGVNMQVGESLTSIGVYAMQSLLHLSDFHIAIDGADGTLIGAYGANSMVAMENGAIAPGGASDNDLYAVYSAAGSLWMNAVTATPGDAANANVGVYAVGGIPGSEAVVTNSVIETGKASATTNYGLHFTSINAIAGNNVISVGKGVDRIGIYHLSGGVEVIDPVFYNNHIEVDTAIGSSENLRLVSPNPTFGFRLAGNNLYGDADCIVNDGCGGCLNDVDDVNDCAFANCTSSVGNIAEEPDFAGSGDYHPSTGSPLIDAGVNPFAYLPVAFADWGWYDMEGNARPQGAGWDIGAYEVE